MHIKEIFAGRRDFHGGDICNYLSDGSYYFPFIIYREQIKNHNNLSMANRGLKTRVKSSYLFFIYRPVIRIKRFKAIHICELLFFLCFLVKVSKN